MADNGYVGLVTSQHQKPRFTALVAMLTQPLADAQALLMGNYIPMKPEGVRVRWYAVTQDGGPLFAWGCASDGLAGWGGGSWPTVLRPAA